MVKYIVRSNELEEKEELIEEGEPVVIEVMDENMMWKKVKARLSKEPLEGGHEVSILMDDASGIQEKTSWYMKILEEVNE